MVSSLIIQQQVSQQHQQQEEWYPGLPKEVAFPPELAAKAWRLGAIYEEYSRKISPEGHQEFHSACFVSLLSALSMRRVKIPLAQADYTPFMVMLMSEPGLYKKTATINGISKVLDAAGLGWALRTGKPTPQKFIHDMAGSVPKDYAELDEISQHRFKQRFAFAGQRALAFGEFGQFLKEMMKESGPMASYQSLLLEMDDCRPTYAYETLGRGDEIVEKPFLSLIGAMTPGNIKVLASRDAELWTSGFWSRVTVICTEQDSSLDAPFELGEVPVPDALIRGLQAWHRRLGIPEVSIEPVYETKKGEEVLTDRVEVSREDLPEQSATFAPGVFEAWKRYRSALKHIATSELQEKDLRASYERLPVKALRVAALLASLENNGHIELCHWAKAQEFAESWRKSLHELYRQVNMPNHGQTPLEESILECIKMFEAEGHKPTVRDMQLRTRALKRAKSKTIKECLAQLQRDAMVVLVRDGKAERYSLVMPGSSSLTVVKPLARQPAQGDDNFSFDEEGM